MTMTRTKTGRAGGPGRALLWAIGILAVFAIAFYVVTIVFGHAQVAINFTQTPWSYQGNFVADKSVATSSSDGTTTIIPASIFSPPPVNVTQLFPATGQNANVNSKAQGTITIYNDYSAAPQELVATTRFVTPDGKIFRIVNTVTVPGATVAANGTITPSSIDTPIIADQGGSGHMTWGPLRS